MYPSFREQNILIFHANLHRIYVCFCRVHFLRRKITISDIENRILILIFDMIGKNLALISKEGLKSFFRGF